MGDFDELRLDFHLRDTVAVFQRFDDFFDQIEVLGTIPDRECARGFRVNRDGPSRELNASGHQRILRSHGTSKSGATCAGSGVRRCRSDSTTSAPATRDTREEVRTYFPLLGDHLGGIRADWHDRHRKRLNLKLQICQRGDVFQRLNQRHIVQRQGDTGIAASANNRLRRWCRRHAGHRVDSRDKSRGGRIRSRRGDSRCRSAFDFQDDVYPLFVRVEVFAFLDEKFNGFADGRVAEINFRNDNRVQLFADSHGARRAGLALFSDFHGAAIKAAIWALPFPRHFPHRLRTGAIVGDFAKLVLLLSDFSTTLFSRDVVFVFVKRLLCRNIRKVKPPKVLVMLCVKVILFHLLYFLPKVWGHLFVEEFRRFDVRQQLQHGTGIRVLEEHFLQQLRCSDIVAFGDALLRKAKPGFGKPSDCRSTVGLGRGCISDVIASVLVMSKSGLVVLVAEGGAAFFSLCPPKILASNAAFEFPGCNGFGLRFLSVDCKRLDDSDSRYEERGDWCGERRSFHRRSFVWFTLN